MNLLYISYWGLDDPLTQATVLPNIRILKSHFEKVYLATIERKRHTFKGTHTDFAHLPFFSASWLPRVLQKFTDLVFYVGKLYFVIFRNDIDFIICRGSSTAIIAVLLHKLTGRKFIIESFEPHAAYMEESHVWKKSSVEYKLQTWAEAQSIRRATFLAPVSDNYSRTLIMNGVDPAKITVMPCAVDFERFQFDMQNRIKTRQMLNIEPDIRVGIYVGKFGDIYLKEEAFAVFQETFEIFDGRFFLIILTPQPIEEVRQQLLLAGYNLAYAHVTYADQYEVAKYLSAADFGFALIRPSPSRRYCSPVKIGEYWASGMPVLLTRGVGDDEKIIQENAAGVIIDFEVTGYPRALRQMKDLLREERTALTQRIAPLAKRYRSFEIISRGYAHIFETAAK